MEICYNKYIIYLVNKENNGRKIYNIYIFLIWYKVYFVDNITSREEL